MVNLEVLSKFSSTGYIVDYIIELLTMKLSTLIDKLKLNLDNSEIP